MVNLTARDQQIYNKILSTKSKSMHIEALYAEFAQVAKPNVMASCSQLLQQQLLTADKAKDGLPIFKAQSLQEAKKVPSATWTNEQKLCHSIIKEAQRNGISLSGIKRKVAAVSMNQVILRKALEGLVKNNVIKTFKPINSPTMSMYILFNLEPPEEVTGGVWYNANQGYDTALVSSICQILLRRTRELTFPKKNDGESSTGKNPIYPFTKARLPSPGSLLQYLQDKKITTAALTVKNVMECMRALELDGKVETIKPLSMGHFDLGDDQPGPSKRRKTEDDDSDSDYDVRKEKEKLKLKERAKEKKRRAKEKEKKEKERKEKEKAKDKKRKKKEKEKEKKKKRKKEKKKRSKGSDSDDSDADSDSDGEMREIGDAPKKKRKRSPSVSSASSSSSSSSSSDSDSDAASDASSKSASSVDTDDIDDEDVPFKPDTSGLPAMMSNPFDLSDTQIVYRATKQLDNSVLLGQMHTPCGRCPQFTFCEESGPVNAKSCEYYSKWLIDEEKGGGWERGTALMKMRPELKEEEEPVEGVEKVANGAMGEAVPNGTGAETNGAAAANGHDEGMDVDSAPVQPEAGAEVDEEPVADDE